MLNFIYKVDNLNGVKIGCLDVPYINDGISSVLSNTQNINSIGLFFEYYYNYKCIVHFLFKFQIQKVFSSKVFVEVINLT